MQIRRSRGEADDASPPVQLGQNDGRPVLVVVVRLGGDGEHPLGHALREEDGVGLGRREEIAVVVRQHRLEVQRDERVDGGLLLLLPLPLLRCRRRHVSPPSTLSPIISVPILGATCRCCCRRGCRPSFGGGAGAGATGQ